MSEETALVHHPPEISIEPNRIRPGSKIKVKGKYFPNDKTIVLIPLGKTVKAQDGIFQKEILMSKTQPPGTYNISATTYAERESAEAELQVDPLALPKQPIMIGGQPVFIAAMFPGGLEAAGGIPGGRMIMDMNYTREQKNKQILRTRLKRPGGLESAVKDARVRWLP